MMKDRLSVQRDQKGGWYIVADGATMHFDTRQEAVKAACSELNVFDELRRMVSDYEANVAELNEKLEWERSRSEQLTAKLDRVHELLDIKEKELEEAKVLEGFHRHFINTILTENFKLKQAITNLFLEKYGSEPLS